MRTIDLKTRGTVPRVVRDQDTLVEIAKWPLGGPGKAVTVPDMRLDVVLMKAVESAGDVLVLEEAQWTRLCDKLNAYPFAFSNADTLAMIDDVLGAVETDVSDLVKAKRAKARH